MPKKIEVGIVVLDDVLMSAVTGIEDTFNFANIFTKEPKEPEFRLIFVSPSRKVEPTHSSVSLKTRPISDDDNFDIVIVPPIVTDIEGLFNYPGLIAWLVKMYHKGTLLSSICSGAFLLAQTGLLDNKRATTHWLFEKEFKNAFPTINTQCNRLLVNEKKVITAGGATAYQNLTLFLINKYHSPYSVHKCASYLLIDTGRDSQQCYRSPDFDISVHENEMENFLTWIKKNIQKELTIKIMAKKMGLHERSFRRRFKNAVNTTPTKYLQNQRIERAKLLLINSKRSFEEITYDVGFNNVSSFRRLFKRETSLNPGEYRKKFNSLIGQH
jgi:transcriptional regulator GlxA family with amidase domain